MYKIKRATTSDPKKWHRWRQWGIPSLLIHLFRVVPARRERKQRPLNWLRIIFKEFGLNPPRQQLYAFCGLMFVVACAQPLWLTLVLPKFSSELMQRTRTERTEPKFGSVLSRFFWLGMQFSSRFSRYLKFPEPVPNRFEPRTVRLNSPEKMWILAIFLDEIRAKLVEK